MLKEYIVDDKKTFSSSLVLKLSALFTENMKLWYKVLDSSQHLLKWIKPTEIQWHPDHAGINIQNVLLVPDQDWKRSVKSCHEL